MDVDPRFFGVLDKKAEEEKIVLCRLDSGEDRDNKVQCVLVTAQESALTLGGLSPRKWEDLVATNGEYTPAV